MLRVRHLRAKEHGGQLVKRGPRKLRVIWRAQVEHACQADVEELQPLLLLMYALLCCMHTICCQDGCEIAKLMRQ